MFPPSSPAPGPIYNPITNGHHPPIMLNDDNGISGTNKILELALQALDVRRMEARSRLVQNVQRIAALGPLKLRHEFYALRFAT